MFGVGKTYLLCHVSVSVEADVVTCLGDVLSMVTCSHVLE